MNVSGELASVALGSNLGDRKAYLCAGLRGLAATPRTSLLSLSRVYETEPMGPADQGPYLNAAVRLATELSPHELLERLLEIERSQGRERSEERWGARTLDLDLLLFGDRRIDDAVLSVPHPGLAERLFVLAPLCDIAPEECHPGLGKTFAELAGALRENTGVRVWRDGSLGSLDAFASKA